MTVFSRKIIPTRRAVRLFSSAPYMNVDGNQRGFWTTCGLVAAYYAYTKNFNTTNSYHTHTQNLNGRSECTMYQGLWMALKPKVLRHSRPQLRESADPLYYHEKSLAGSGKTYLEHQSVHLCLRRGRQQFWPTKGLKSTKR